MKIIESVILGVAVAKRDRKVPPRHPLNRLNRLRNKLAVQVLEHPALEAEWSKKRRTRVLGNLQSFADKMKSRFDSDNCGFFDSSLPNGGPDPDPHLRDNGKPRRPVSSRRRRQADFSISDDWRQNTWVAEDSSFMWLYEYCFEGQNWENLSDDQFDFITDSADDLCEEDDEECAYFDMGTCQFRGKQDQILVRGGGKSRALSANPQKAWKQVTTGLRKWATRYLNNCHGMRKDKLPAKRARSMYNRWSDKIPAL
ncbi:Oidioi.mRNA.OKI2018_I69.chr2.g5241.t1.cds [Oikopleura dioica]|uniref:Oidioi.mRNA.OKI2018_I69.chr2.g5241.t1.cds n=1 Tax=Oikopleura dioica TaxID=34765 RepID=A0ABN7T8X7_OIKDI|nr:Oidioi.mRNA.OKI2018_I69.chr2.g5241.t1.cds [Oikopleura dioica]